MLGLYWCMVRHAKTAKLMSRLHFRPRSGDSLRMRSLDRRLAEYARRHALDFADEPRRYALCWEHHATRYFIEIEKQTAAVRSGTIVGGVPVYHAAPTYLGTAPLEELLDAHRRDYAGTR